jgi:hypothetical protein
MVSAAQYITELLCENKAKRENKDLGFRFWVNKEWLRFYRDQIATANKLLLKYSDKAIIAALKNKKAENIYSLRAPHLKDIIQKEQDILDTKNTKITKEYDRSENKNFTTNNKTKTKLSKLKEIE